MRDKPTSPAGVQCPDCEGAGELDLWGGERCHPCAGTGTISSDPVSVPFYENIEQHVGKR